MKTLIINGSPRKNGNTSYIVELLSKRLEGDIDIIRSYDMDFSPCTDCRKCIKTKECIFNDKLSSVIKNINSYDAIVLASPLYYNQPTGSLLALASRFQLIFNAKMPMKQKKGIIVLTGGGDTIINSSDAEKTMRIIMRGLGADDFEYIRSLNTSKIPAWDDKGLIYDFN